MGMGGGPQKRPGGGDPNGGRGETPEETGERRTLMGMGGRPQWRPGGGDPK